MAVALNIPQTITTSDEMWALFLGLPQKVREEFSKRLKMLDREERKRARMEKYATTLTPRQRAVAKDMAESISTALADVKNPDYKGTSFDDFLNEFDSEE